MDNSQYLGQKLAMRLVLRQWVIGKNGFLDVRIHLQKKDRGQ